MIVEGDATGGGTLKTFNDAGNVNLWSATARLFLSGTGVGGTAGALHNVGKNSVGFHWIQLDADVLVHSELTNGQIQFRNHFDMQGHTARCTGQGEITFYVTITNPGDLIEDGRIIRFHDPQVHGLNGEGRPHRISVRKGAGTVYNMMPYIISIIVLAFTSKNSRAPKAEGIPYDKGMR